MVLKLKSRSLSINARLEHQRLTSLINSMADAVIAVDENVHVVIYNGVALNILDVNTIKTGDPLSKLFFPIDVNNQSADVNELVKSAQMPITNRELRLKYSDDSFINLYISVAPVHLGYGEHGQKGYVLLLRDITREKSLEEERDEFISVVSHELRTPIAIAEGNLSNTLFIASKDQLSKAIIDALDDAHKQILFLADMINDLSTLSRAERGALKVNIVDIDINTLLTDLRKSYLDQIESKGLKLNVAIDPDVINLNSSELYVREILQNFITNAIKYTHEGLIEIKASHNDKGVVFSVKDSGIGISKADQERVFDKFFRSEDFRTRQANGTGLGLYVTVKLAHLIHAEISLTSELNKGSDFTIFIPNLK